VLADTLIFVAAYFLGSIPTGFLAGRMKGIDIRAAGSGNIGATNALRVLGKPAGILVLVIDGLKGYAAAAWLVSALLPALGASGADAEPVRIGAGIAAVLGHNYPCWLKFKGGKGVATSAGVYFALAPLAAGIAVATFALTVALTRYVSVGSMAAAIALPTAVWCLDGNNLMLGIVTTVVGAMVIFRHKSNIKRLLAGTENRLGRPREAGEGAK